MSIFSEIDQLVSETEALVSQANKTVVQPPEPSGCPGGCPPGQTCRDGTCVRTGTRESETEETKRTVTTTVDSSKSNGSESDSGNETDTDQENGSGDPVKTGSESNLPTVGTDKALRAIGQNVLKTYNEHLKPKLQDVDPGVWMGVGGGLLLLYVLNSNKQ